MTAALLAALGASTGYALAAVLQAVAVRRNGPGAVALARSPWYLLALLGDGTAWLLSLVALRRLPLFAVQSVLAGSLALTVVLARLLLGTRMRRADVVAVVVMVGALAVVGSAGHAERAEALGAHGTAGLVAVVALLAAAYAGAHLLERRPGRRPLPGWGFAVLAGLSFSCAAVAARALHAHDPHGPPGPDAAAGAVGHSPPPWHPGSLLTEPLAWVLLAAGLLGVRAYAAAVHHGGVGRAAALLWGVEVVASTAAGVHLLGDGVRPGWGPAAVVGVLAVLGCAAVLARSPGEQAAEQAAERGHALPPPL